MERVATTLEYFPGQGFRDKNGPCTVKQYALNASVANNQTVVAAVSGKKIRLLTVVLSNVNAGATDVAFLSNNATALGWLNQSGSTSAPVILPKNEDGWFESAAAGESITANVATTACRISGRYIEWTP